MGWDEVNLITTVGSFIFAAGVLIFLVNVVLSLKRGVRAGANPWDAPTLEWAVSSPPPAYNFATIPTIASRHPLWEGRIEGEREHSRTQLEEGYLLMRGRETLGTSPIDAKPVVILKMPEDSYTPFLVGLFVSLLFVGLLLHSWTFTALMMASSGAALSVWMWPRRKLGQRTTERKSASAGIGGEGP
jgi:cytochrome c oxidase subunit 1/cytochrome c oxidase subunit I+III